MFLGWQISTGSGILLIKLSFSEIALFYFNQYSWEHLVFCILPKLKKKKPKKRKKAYPFTAGRMYVPFYFAMYYFYSFIV